MHRLAVLPPQGLFRTLHFMGRSHSPAVERVQAREELPSALRSQGVFCQANSRGYVFVYGCGRCWRRRSGKRTSSCLSQAAQAPGMARRQSCSDQCWLSLSVKVELQMGWRPGRIHSLPPICSLCCRPNRDSSVEFRPRGERCYSGALVTCNAARGSCRR